MKLYWFWSFNPQKVRLALHELGVAHDLVAVDLFRGQQRHPARGVTELASALPIVEAQLAKHAFMTGAEFSLVDCCYGAVLDALSLSRFDLAPYPYMNAYLARLRARPAWAKCEFRTKEA